MYQFEFWPSIGLVQYSVGRGVKVPPETGSSWTVRVVVAVLGR